jgi:hypothetical protein
MAISPAPREANSPAPDYAQQIIEEVRARIAPEDWVLDETRNRRGKLSKAAERFHGALRSFASGSLAHRTVNNPISDGDAGLVLNRVVWFHLGPDGGGEGPDAVMRELGRFVCDELRDEYPNITFELTKRAILFEFHEPMDDEDPSVDLVVCLTRRDEPGFWIPNRDRDRWDASDPETHTKLMTDPPTDLRQHRAQVIRLAKAAIRGDDDQAVLCSWNISALALGHIKQVGKHVETLAAFFEDMADSIEAGPTPDPADVSAPIKLPEGITREKAVARLRFFAARVREAIQHRHDHARALAALADVFPAQLTDAPRSEKSRIADELRRGAVGPAVTSAFGPVKKSPRSFGDAPA